MSKRRTIQTVIALALACAIVAGYKLAAAWRDIDAAAMPLSSCDLSVQECVVALPPHGQLTISITPRPIRTLQKLTLDVKTNGVRAERIEIDFDGVDMSMGYNRPVLSRNGDHFSGQTLLPLCITGTMTWKATVLVSTDKGHIALPFHFEVVAR